MTLATGEVAEATARVIAESRGGVWNRKGRPEDRPSYRLRSLQTMSYNSTGVLASTKYRLISLFSVTMWTYRPSGV